LPWTVQAGLGRECGRGRFIPNPPGLGQALEIVLEQAAPAIGSYSDFDSVLLTTAPAKPHVQGAPIDVYICAGQSN